mgnify:CR=1 FL=1
MVFHLIKMQLDGANLDVYLQDLTNAGVVYLCHFVQGLAVTGPQKPELLQVGVLCTFSLTKPPLNQKNVEVEIRPELLVLLVLGIDEVKILKQFISSPPNSIDKMGMDTT